MRIGFVVHDYHRNGGHSRYVAELATRFAREHEVHVFANRIEADEHSNISFHRVPAWRWNALTTVLTFPIPATVMARPSRFDVLHGQGFCCCDASVLTTHMCIRAWDEALRQFGNGVSFRHSIFNAIAGALEHALYRFSAHTQVIAISTRVAEDIRRHYRCSLPMDVIHHGVDLDLFSPATRLGCGNDKRQELRLPPHEFVYLFVGDLTKGAQQVMAALAKLPAGTVVFVSKSAPHEYEQMAKDHGVADRVRFSGPTTKVQQYYAAADAFVFPSPYDTFGMVGLEAMASGLPVILSRAAGVSELLRHRENGFILEDPSNVIQLASLMSEVAADPAHSAWMGSSARRTAESYSWDEIATRTMQTYRMFLNRQPAV